MIMTKNFFRRGCCCASLLIASCGFAAEHFFTPPELPFIIEPKEQISTLTISTGPVEAAQQLINSARPTKSNAVLVIHVSGKLIVGSTPLRLGSRMCLILDNGASITAAANATAKSLVQIEDAEFVSISSGSSERGVLDGQGVALTGITVGGCGKVNMDDVSIRGCSVGAISYTGRDAAAVNDAGSFTRCFVQDCGNGLVATQTAGFMCLDNEFRNNRGAAVTMTSQRSVIAGNDFIRNKTGVVSASERGVVARNFFDGNKSAIKLKAASAGNLVNGNRSRGPAGELLVGGKNNEIFGNDLLASAQTIPGSENNLFVNNAGLNLEMATPLPNFFNPPTFNNPHSNNVIVPGMGRFDLTILGATNRYQPADLAAAQEGLQKARVEHSNDVVVLRLQGNFVSHQPAGLEIPANTCVILDGSIRADPGTARDPVYGKGEPITQVVRLSPQGHCSFSGGTLDGGHQVSHGISATNECIALIEGVSIKGAVRDGIRTKGRESVCPLFINGCTIADSGGRGIWLHVAGNVHTIGHTCVGNQQDGIDVDAHANDCNVLFNICNGNRRHGVFIEEAVTNNLVFGNLLLGNNRSGIHVWNEEVVGNTGPNIIAANLCRGNVKGVSVGGRAGDRTAGGNFFFNNVCVGNRDLNLVSGNSHATNNYFSQLVIVGGAEKSGGAFNQANLIFNAPVSQ